MNLREKYLKEEWIPYPSLSTKVLNVKDLLHKYAKLSAEKDKLKTDDFWLAGRIQKGQTQDKTYYFTIESHSEALELEFQPNCRISEHFDAKEILSTGDQILIQGYWREIQVEGFDVKVKRIIAHQIQLLAPSLEPYYLDNFNYKKSKQWQFFLQQIRKVFQVLDFVEVHTPSLVPSPGTETFLDHFITEFQMGKRNLSFYLPTSPELHLKKMIAAGWTRIYEIKNCFRNGEISEKHQPEFWMLEWYRAYSHFDALIKDIQGMLNFLKLHWPEPIQNFAPLKVTTVTELFQHYLDFKLTPQTELSELKLLAKKNTIETLDSDSWDDIFYRLFIEKIEPFLGFDAPTIVKNYPPSQAALAKINSEGWADRFEFYWNGLEIANAFYELNDPIEQEKRFHEDNKIRVQLGKPPVPIDDEFLKALRSGFPPTAGIALGLDRLFMAITSLNSIAKTRAFPLRSERL